MQSFLTGNGILARKLKPVILHDLINNPISKHRSNNNGATSFGVARNPNRVQSSYRSGSDCRREGTSDNFLCCWKVNCDIWRSIELLSHQNNWTLDCFQLCGGIGIYRTSTSVRKQKLRKLPSLKVNSRKITSHQKRKETKQGKERKIIGSGLHMHMFSYSAFPT